MRDNKPVLTSSGIRTLRVGLMLMAWTMTCQFFYGITPTPREKELAWREFMRRDLQANRRLKPQRARYPVRRRG